MLRFALPAAIALGALAAPAALTQPAAPRLELPLACPNGRCVIQQYFDVDSGPAARDHRCGPKAYNGHDGTDFRVPTRAAMLAGVAVRAAAAGTVKNVRDGVPDHLGSDVDIAAAKGRECGNGVLLAHPGGWETQYCHMRNGSIRVRPGQSVAAGATLGQVGQTGEAAFPHLHLGVREGQREVDPFAYGAQPLACGAGGRSLWSP
ncbi:MAG: M23 family metallopeptidase, partial [Pseudomonadota bacterium]|nr:M23 family metallopeptidase [Pseudomonadota bacterium]